MSATTHVTADELLALPMGMGKRHELIAGELRTMSPSGWRHGQIAARVAELVGEFIRKHNLGLRFGAETGFHLKRDPDTVRAPDFAYIATAHLPETEPKDSFWPGAPDLAVEILSPGDRTSEVSEKIAEWFDAGCRSVWVIDPKLRRIVVYGSPTNTEIRTSGQQLSDDPILPGFSCLVDEIFE